MAKKISKQQKQVELEEKDLSGGAKVEMADKKVDVGNLFGKLPWWVPAILIVFIVILGFAYTRGWLFAARVNNELVTRWELWQTLEKNYATETLQNIIVERLIRQEAAKQGVNISADDLKKRIDEISKQVPDGDLGKALSAQGMTRQQFEDQISLNLIVEKLVEPKVSVSEGDIDNYINENKDNLDLKAENIRDQVREQVKQTKLYQEARNLVTQLQEAAKITKYL